MIMRRGTFACLPCAYDFIQACPELFRVQESKNLKSSNEPPCSKLQGIRGKNLMLQKHLALPSSKLQGIVKFKGKSLFIDGFSVI
jgi:hypothetical protein